MQIDSHDCEIKDNKELRRYFCLGYAVALLLPLLTIPTITKFINLNSGELQMEANEATMAKLEFGAIALVDAVLVLFSTFGVVLASNAISFHKKENKKLKSLKLIKE